MILSHAHQPAGSTFMIVCRLSSNRQVGRLELADQGTLFLDEVGDIPIEIQLKLLRALPEREFERPGSNRTKKVDVRIVDKCRDRLRHFPTPFAAPDLSPPLESAIYEMFL
jgi:transcriptional regulator of aromatic amino acid metabolism